MVETGFTIFTSLRKSQTLLTGSFGHKCVCML